MKTKSNTNQTLRNLITGRGRMFLVAASAGTLAAIYPLPRSYSDSSNTLQNGCTDINGTNAICNVAAGKDANTMIVCNSKKSSPQNCTPSANVCGTTADGTNAPCAPLKDTTSE